jgi:predicted GNAT family acetyltransferase
MKNKNISFIEQLSFQPLVKENWKQFEQLFGEKGACGNCWCMSFRLKKSDFENGKLNGKNKESMKKLVWDNKPTGILTFFEGKAIAWSAFSPREDFIRMEKSRIHKRIDNKPVWSIPCTFISKDYRKKGLSVEILKGIIEYAKENNIKIIEAYPTIPTSGKLPDTFAWIGLYKSFERAGFKIVDRKSKNRPMVRFEVIEYKAHNKV